MFEGSAPRGRHLLLFAEKDRSRISPMKAGEGVFYFYDTCAWSSCESYRRLLNTWVGFYPETERHWLITRLTSDPPTKFYEGLAELVVHEAFRSRVHRVEHHPIVVGTSNRPDFLLLDQRDSPVAYVEVTTYGAAHEAIGKGNQAAVIYNAVEAIRLPAGYVFGYRLNGAGTRSPPMKPLLRAIGEWVQDAVHHVQVGSPETRQFFAGDWNIELTLHNVGSSKVYERAIGFASSKASWIDPCGDLRATLSRKSSRYGDLGVPYIIAVADCTGRMSWGEGLFEEVEKALFGRIVHRVDVEKLESEALRDTDGFFGCPDNPKRRHISAVLVLPQPDIWGMRNPLHQPAFFHHPWARSPLPPELLPIPGIRHVAGAQFERTDGSPLADFLGIPEEWPPRDDKARDEQTLWR